MELYLVLILLVLVADALLQWIANTLNARHISPELPEEFRGWYDDAKYRQSQDYLKVNTRFEQIQSLITTPLVLLFLTLGGLGLVHGWAQHVSSNLITAGLIFSGVLLLLTTALNLPFEWYDTFVIEEKFGFNRTNRRTFVADRIKSLLLTVLLGGPLLAGILWFFSRSGDWGWAIAWAVVAAFQLIMMLIAPSLLLPLFNKFTPIPDGELKIAVHEYAARQKYRLSGIYSIDGSRRSSKANAYVTGFGKLKRIALYDTLIEKHSVPELVAVLAHEIGHAKLGHIRKMMILSLLSTGLTFFLLGQFIGDPALYRAIGIEPAPDQPLPIYAGIIAFSLLMSPLNRILSIFIYRSSRRHEFEADAFAKSTTGHCEDLITALKKLSVENLSNLSPHPLTIWLSYSHPPVLERIRALR